jgi:hypothetical protein
MSPQERHELLLTGMILTVALVVCFRVTACAEATAKPCPPATVCPTTGVVMCPSSATSPIYDLHDNIGYNTLNPEDPRK